MASRGSGSVLRALGASLRSRRTARRVLVLGGVAAVGLVISTDDRISNLQAIRSLRSSLLVKADAAARAESSDPKGDAFRVDPDTEVRFPITLPASSSFPSLHLVGLGVRKVSFLRVKVYSAGFYFEEGQIKGLHHVPGWHNYTAQHLLTPPTKHPSDPLDAPQFTGEALMKSLLDKPVACAVKIVPVRNTDFSHLRDGFTRALVARQKAARTSGTLPDPEDTRITESIQSLKSFFPSQKVPKGNSLCLIRTPKLSLVVEYEGRVLGEVKEPWIAREMMLAYFADKDVISPKLKEDVAQGFENLMKQ